MKRIFFLLLSLTLLTSCAAEVKSAPYQEKTTDEFYADFALNLLRKSYQKGENALISPLSVTIALGMISDGASCDTAEECAALLGLKPEMLSPYCMTLIEKYSSLGGSSESILANSLWCDPDWVLNDSFVQNCQNSYAAQLFQADLQSSETVLAINDWVNEATHGMIPLVLSERFSDQTMLAFFNTAYFKNQFEHPFIASEGWFIDFQNADGTMSQPQGMSNSGREEIYLSHEDGQGVVLPYDDGKLGLLLMLPNEGVNLNSYLESWDGRTITDLLENQIVAKVHLGVPKFKAEWSGELKDSLMSLGMVRAFSLDTANFATMGHSEKGPFFLNSLFHKSAFEVNENGTTSAAVTASSVYGLPDSQEESISLVFNRAFVYGIVDLHTGFPLFLGIQEQLERTE